MKVVILAGGLGTRLSEFTELIPKPMVTVGGRPILWHIMSITLIMGTRFYLALGYKAQFVKEYFLNYRALNSDFSVNLQNGVVTPHHLGEVDWHVTLVDTGLHTMTGGRVKRLHKFIGNETFLLTYGDGVSNVDLESLINFHREHGKLVTMTAVRPNARFGELELKGNEVKKFQEKPQLHDGWVNGGFFVIEPRFMELIDNDEVMLEREPFEKAVQKKQLMAFLHHGFWQCMDTKRDQQLLESLWDDGAPWQFKRTKK